MSKDNISFEQALIELEKISDKLESQDVTLDEAIELFEKGTRLSDQCAKKLETAKQKIEILTEGGKISND